MYILYMYIYRERERERYDMPKYITYRQPPTTVQTNVRPKNINDTLRVEQISLVRVRALQARSAPSRVILSWPARARNA